MIPFYSAPVAALLVMALVSGCSTTPAAKDWSKPLAMATTTYPSADLTVLEESKILPEADMAIAATKERIKLIKAIPKDKRTFANTVLAMEDIEHSLGDVYYKSYYYKSTHEKKSARDLANKAILKFNDYYNDLATDKELFDALYAVKKSKQAAALSKVQTRLLDEKLKDYLKSGMGLSDQKRAIFKKLLKENSELTNKIQKNIAEKDLILTFSKKQLKGLSDDQLKALYDKKTKSYKVNLKTYAPGYSSVITYAKDPKIRKQVADARNVRVKDENKDLIYKVIQNRMKMASLFDGKYKNWADFRIDGKMAATAARATALLNDIDSRLDMKFASEKAKIKAMKRKETGSTEGINYYDVGYYLQKYNKSAFKLEPEKIKEYFPWQPTLDGMFAIYSEIFDLKISKNRDVKVQIPNATAYTLSDKKTGEVYGIVYIDPHPRKGKYNHFAMFPLVRQRMKDGKRNVPLCAVVGNWPVGVDGKPPLMTIGQVETLFHEFGHAIHHVVSQSPYASLAGTAVPRDFVEAPSQVLEYWLESYPVLERISGHYKTGKPLPKEELAKIMKARKATIAHRYKGQVAYGRLDLLIHSYEEGKAGFPKDPLTLISATNDLFDSYYPRPDDHAFVTSFGHLFGGYDAGYYGYAWADVISADIASRFEKAKDGYLSKDVGMKLREEIYKKGNTRDVNESIRAFLGRDYNTDAFFERLQRN